MLVEIAPTLDPATRLPVALVDSTAMRGQLPSESQVLDAIEDLPTTDFVVVFFASGTPSTPNINWLHKTYRLFSRTVKKRVRKIYLVHGNWWTKTLRKMLGGSLSPKFVRKIVLVDSLSMLATVIDITMLNIRPQVYLDNFDAEDEILVPKHTTPIFGETLPREPTSMWHDALRYLWALEALDLTVFDPTGGSPLVLVLKQAFDRGQTLHLSEYGPQITIAILKLYLLELPEPLIDIGALDLPILDTENYTQRTIGRLDHAAHSHLKPLMRWLTHSVKTFSVAPREVAGRLAPALFGLYNPTRDQQAIITRFTRNMLEQQIYEAPNTPKKSLRSVRQLNAEAASTGLPGLPVRPLGSPMRSSLRSPLHMTELNNSNGPLAQEMMERPSKPRPPPKLPPRHSPEAVPPSPALLQPRALRLLENLAPPPQVPMKLRPRASLRNIRGRRVAEMAQKYEPWELDTDSP